MAKLISMVSRYPELYNSALDSYKNCERKQKAWAAVSEQLKLPVSDCRKKWKNLRDTFTRHRRMELQTQSSEEPFRSGWKYYNQMYFISPFLMRDRAAGPFVPSSSTSTGKGQTPSDHPTEEEGAGKELKEECPEGQEETAVRSLLGASDASRAAFIIHEVGEEDLTEPGHSPSPSLSSPLTNTCKSASPHRSRRKRRRPAGYGGGSDSELSYSMEDDAADEMFFFSLLPYLKRLSFERKSALKLKIHQLIYEAAFK